MHKRIWLLLLFLTCTALAQQLSIPRIDSMTTQPSPYLMRNWRQVAVGYDSLVFNPSLSGQYLPLISFHAQGTNYPQNGSICLNTVVGDTRTFFAEAINVMPAIVGASLAGVDKRNQYGYNFVLMAQDFFNKRSSENVYLNTPTSSSGNDWWYETMPNVYFYQMNSLYPHTGDFDYQFTTVADRWLQAVQAMGGKTTPWSVPYMNYRAWSLSTMTPLASGVVEPEAAGTISWILYTAYKVKHNDAYRIGAEQAMEFLNGLNSNPAYELQLPYGVYNAARMNAELGTNYDVQKMLDWCFEVGPLRTWGSMVGNWGGYDVSGLIGENYSDCYAFIMNGFQQAGALLPLLRYDERFANALGKWALNLANASRLFFPNYLPDQNQDFRDWSKQYDPQSYIAHESMRQTLNGMSPFATGDAVGGGWGKTTLSLYSTSSVGYLGAILDTTDVPEILRFDLLKTDFYHDTAYATYLYYNPYKQEKSISVVLPAGNWSLYDVVTKSYTQTNVSGITALALPASSARVIVLVPANGVTTYNGTKILVNGVVIDYHSGQNHGSLLPRIKSLTPLNNTLPQGSGTLLYCIAVPANSDTLSYQWRTTNGAIKGSGSVVTYTASSQSGNVSIFCTVSDQHGNSITDSLIITVVDRINHAPQINSLSVSPQKVNVGAPVHLTCKASDADNDTLSYSWYTQDGALLGKGTTITWNAPVSSGNYYITCTVSDGFGGSAKDSIILLVRDFANYGSANMIAYYPFNGNAADATGNGNDGFVYQTTLTTDRFGKTSSAYAFNGTTSYIQIHNSPALNFQAGITLNFWMKLGYLYTTREQYPISHGNWQYRWKVSLNNNILRWTVKTTTGVHDLDASTQFVADSLYNITAMYDGSAMEIYVNGKLDAASPWSGGMLTTDYDLIFGQSLPGSNAYGFNGILDDIRIYNNALLPDSVSKFYDIVSAVRQDKVSGTPSSFSVRSFPNPCNGQVSVMLQIPYPITGKLALHDILGREIKTIYKGRLNAGEQKFSFDLGALASGVYFVRLDSKTNVSVDKLLILK